VDGGSMRVEPYENERFRLPTPRSQAAAWFFRRLEAVARSGAWTPVILADPCAYCNTRKRNRTRDHVHPRCAGGKLFWWNVAPACSDCQREKASVPLVRFYARRAKRQRAEAIKREENRQRRIAATRHRSGFYHEFERAN
jgi:hypothetical protein